MMYLLSLVAEAAGLVRRTMAGCCLYSQHRTRWTNRITSDCFFLHSFDMYAYAPAASPKNETRRQNRRKRTLGTVRSLRMDKEEASLPMAAARRVGMVTDRVWVG
jgi:hypothetical protein